MLLLETLTLLKTPEAFFISVVLQTHLPYISLLLIPEVQLSAPFGEEKIRAKESGKGRRDVYIEKDT